MYTVEDLVGEFKAVGLSDIDSRRYAFCTLARNKGWNSARIGRYLGVSRARVGQRVERLRRYADENSMPVLKDMLISAVKTDADGTPDVPVAFLPDQWNDLIFAQGILELVAAELVAA